MSVTTSAWLVLLCPLVGTVVIAAGYRVWPGRAPGWIGTAAIGLSFVFAVITLITILGKSPEHRQYTSSLWDYAFSVGVDAKVQILVDPLSVFMILVVSGVSTMIHLYSVTYMTADRGFTRYFAYLNYFVFSMLLLVLAGNFVLLIVGWAFVGAASYLLISFWYRRRTATRAGIKAFVINVVGDVGLVLGTFFLLQAHRHRRLPEDVRGRGSRVRAQRHRPRRRLPVAARRGVREIGAGAASDLAPGRDGGPHAGVRADPRGDDGDRRRVPDRADAPAVRARADGRRRGRDRRRPDHADRRDDRARADRHQARDRVLDDVPDRLHDRGRVGRGVLRGPLPSDDARVLQGAAVHGRRLDHRRDGRRPVARPDGRVPQSAAVHVRLLCYRRPGPVGPAAFFGLAVEGRHPCVRSTTAAAAS